MIPSEENSFNGNAPRTRCLLTKGSKVLIVRSAFGLCVETHLVNNLFIFLSAEYFQTVTPLRNIISIKPFSL